MILKSELNAKNKITAIRTLAVPDLRYSFVLLCCVRTDVSGYTARRS